MSLENTKNEIAVIESAQGEVVKTAADTAIICKLSKPFTWEDKTYTEFRCDYEKLIGSDMIAIESEMAALGQYVITPEISTPFLIKLAAKAAGVGSDVMEHLPLRDFGKVKNTARNFLTKTGLSD